MIIKNMKSENISNRARISAMVIWEDCERPNQKVFFETDEKYTDSISCNPHAFVAGCIAPAMYNDEKRIHIDAALCPEFQEGLKTAIQWIYLWHFQPEHQVIKIEAKTLSRQKMHKKDRHAAGFISGGIDSLALLRANRLNYPLEHPGSFKDGLIVFGQNIESDNRPQAFQSAYEALLDVANDCNIELIPVYTNIRDLDESTQLFHETHGMILAAVAHAFEMRINSASVASSDDIPSLSILRRQHIEPLGSHPLLEPNCSSSSVRIRHEGLTLTRIQKTKLIAEWDVGLQNIKVCAPNWPSDNCGRCEKCTRTMLALLALGFLDKTRSFPHDDVNEQMVSRIRIRKSDGGDSYSTTHNYMELIPLLKEKGRDDLVRAIEDLIARYYYREPRLKTSLKRFDERYLMGSLVKVKKILFS